MQAAHAEDFWRVADSVLGASSDRSLIPVNRPLADVGLASLGDLPCDRRARARDQIAWEMSLVGYSAREIADVVSGHLARADIDRALRLLMTGQTRTAVAAFLEARWREPAPAPVAPPPALARARNAPLPAEIEGAVTALARQYQIAPALVRAVITAESGGNPWAVSRAGAIGLMQLMPLTASALGVDPWTPLENLRGGIAYLAGMLRAYGENPTLALIAYNAGPQHADRVRAGKAVPYRETRRYLDAVSARYPLR